MDMLWWQQVPNARKYILEIKRVLTYGKSALIIIPDRMPWRNTFENEVISSISDGIRMVEVILDSDLEPGEIVLNRFCREEVRDHYRPAKGYSKYLAEAPDTVLPARYIWIKKIDTNREKEWCSFVSDYYKHLREKKQQGALFILESENGTNNMLQEGIEIIDFESYITQFDRFIFNALLVSSIKGSSGIKNYCAELLSEIAGNDIELAGMCGSVHNRDAFLNDPKGFLSSLHMITRSDGSICELNIDDAALNRAIWSAQIRTVFPTIESFRASLIDKYREQLESQMPITNSDGDEYKSVVDIEINTLHYLLSQQKLAMTEFEKLMVKKCTEARNELAHLVPISLDRVQAILSLNR